MPVIDRTRQRDGFFTRDAFRYYRETDAYRCPADKPLPYKGIHRANRVRVYRSRAADCTGCRLKPQCTTSRLRGVSRLVDKDARDQVRALAGTEAYALARLRRKRIERVFGHVKRTLKMQTLKLRGVTGAAEKFTMAAAAYNLQLLATKAAPGLSHAALRIGHGPMGYKKIVCHLNASGSTLRGRRWHVSNIRYVLTRSTCRGKHLCGVHDVRNGIKRPEEEWEVIDVPIIIPEADWLEM